MDLKMLTRFECKYLINVMSALGLSASYADVTLFESSAIHQSNDHAPNVNSGFAQYVFDNADFNANTIDGLNSIHIMGGIQIITPNCGRFSDVRIPKLKKIPSRTEVAALAKIDIQKCSTFAPKTPIHIKDLDSFSTDVESPNELPISDVLWMCSRILDIGRVGGWNGFMTQLTKYVPAEESNVVFLPFIQLPPSDYDTILTALHEAIKHTRQMNMKTTVVTFDQPLYYKAREIVARASPEDPISKVVVRLGGFHTVMSFEGCIGHTMAGSGLKEILSTIYAPLSVEKMLSGHSYSRATRGHFFVQEALLRLIFKNYVSFTEEEKKTCHLLIDNLCRDIPILNNLADNESMKSISEKLRVALKMLENKGATSQLWIQYLTMVNILRNFMRAERMGLWQLHLACIKAMIPYFKACGHFLYAKSAHLYFQDMMALKNTMDADEYFSFTNGNFTVRRSEKYWSGTWSDMVIEQSIMKSSKSVGGLVHGRGWTDSVMSKWILSMPTCNEIIEGIEKYSGVNYVANEQHKDWSESRINRDRNDVDKILLFLQDHFPFPDTTHLMSLATGIVAPEDKVNCHKAFSIGSEEVKKTVGQNFFTLKFQRKNIVQSLASMSRSLKIKDNSVTVDPLLLFQRISLLKKSDKELRKYFAYELAPYPLSLFNEDGTMRKTKKSSLFELFKRTEILLNPSKFYYVVDGGYLLHKVVWKKNSVLSDILKQYVSYIKNHFGHTACVVFDGYNKKSVKNFERHRRYSSVQQVKVQLLSEEIVISLKQEDFLSNVENKVQLINYLTAALLCDGFSVEQAEGDADSMIVAKALEMSVLYPTILVGEDVDLLVLLIALASKDQDVHFLKPNKSGTSPDIFSIQEIQSEDAFLQRSIMFLHAVSGCDTTSAFFQKGKILAHKIIKEDCIFQEVISVFNDPDATQNEVFESGCRFIVAMYGASNNTASLNESRFLSFVKRATRNRVNLASLPPTEEAARQHLYRVYLQIQLWKGNQKNISKWGWQEAGDNSFIPVQTNFPAAPEILLKTIFCNCRKGCTSGCTCRKHGLKCSAACGHCFGLACLNASRSEEEEDDDLTDPDD